MSIAVKPVERLTARPLPSGNITLAFQTKDGDSRFSVSATQLNELIERLLVVSFNPWILAQRPAPTAEGERVETLLTLPLEKISASHSPAKGTVGISFSLLSGLRAAFEMPIQLGLALSQQLQSAAGRAQTPKSTAQH